MLSIKETWESKRPDQLNVQITRLSQVNVNRTLENVQKEEESRHRRSRRAQKARLNSRGTLHQVEKETNIVQIDNKTSEKGCSP